MCGVWNLSSVGFDISILPQALPPAAMPLSLSLPVSLFLSLFVCRPLLPLPPPTSPLLCLVICHLAEQSLGCQSPHFVAPLKGGLSLTPRLVHWEMVFVHKSDLSVLLSLDGVVPHNTQLLISLTVCLLFPLPFLSLSLSPNLSLSALSPLSVCLYLSLSLSLSVSSCLSFSASLSFSLPCLRRHSLHWFPFTDSSGSSALALSLVQSINCVFVDCQSCRILSAWHHRCHCSTGPIKHCFVHRDMFYLCESRRIR